MTTLGSSRVAVIGTGLIGASVGLAAKRAGAERVAGFDADPAALALGVERGAVDVAAASLEQAVEGADLVVVATPVGAIAACVAQVLEATDERCTVTDVGSTKARICSELAAERRFVGGHPLSGGGSRGPDEARADLFAGSRWFLVRLPEIDPERFRVVHAFVSSLGAEPVEIDPAAHDELVALVSHLPHVLANVLVNQAGSADVAGHDPLALAGRSFEEMTRVAGANAGVWVEIFLDNAHALGRALSRHRLEVDQLETAVRDRDVEALSRWIEEAAENRRRLRPR